MVPTWAGEVVTSSSITMLWFQFLAGLRFPLNLTKRIRPVKV